MADPIYDARAEAGKSWMKGGEGQSRDGDEESTSLVEALLPMALAQGLDLLTTEHFLNQNDNPYRRMQTQEMNPLPGMGSSLGRVGWSVGDLLLTALLHKKFPKMVEKGYVPARVGVSTALARGNEDLVDMTRAVRAPHFRQVP